jgi:hypothetical protein
MKKRILSLIVATIIIAVAGAGNENSQVKSKTQAGLKPVAISAPERQSIESIVREYILKKPEVVYL